MFHSRVHGCKLRFIALFFLDATKLDRHTAAVDTTRGTNLIHGRLHIVSVISPKIFLYDDICSKLYKLILLRICNSCRLYGNISFLVINVHQRGYVCPCVWRLSIYLSVCLSVCLLVG